MSQICLFPYLLQPLAQTPFRTRWGDFMLQAFGQGAKESCVVLTAGQPADGCLVRLHSACLTGDVLGSLHCDCGRQREEALQRIGREGCGVFIYALDQEGRGHGLVNKLRAYQLQATGLDTVEADHALGLPADTRCFVAHARLLRHYFRLTHIRLLSNNPEKIRDLEAEGLTVDRVPFWPDVGGHNKGYIDVKRDKLGQLAL